MLQRITPNSPPLCNMADKKSKKAAKAAKQSNRVEKNKKVEFTNNKSAIKEKKTSKQQVQLELKQLEDGISSLATTGEFNGKHLEKAELLNKQAALGELRDSKFAELEEIEEAIANLIRKQEDTPMEDADGTNADKTHPNPQETDTPENPQASNTPKKVSQNGSSASNPVEIKTEKASNPTAFRGHGKTPSNPITEDEMDLLKPSHHQLTSDLENPDQHRELIVVKNGIGGDKIGIVKYGPPNAAIFRREDVTGFDLSDVKDISIPGTRLGEKCEYVQNKKVWEYTRHDLISIQGVALPESRTLKDLKRKRRGDGVYMPIDILIKWKKNDAVGVEHSWETTTSFRRIWGNHGDGADAAIKQAAGYAEKRFNEWKKGERPARNRSPTVDPEFGKSKSKHASKSKKTTQKSKKTATKGKNKKGHTIKTRTSKKRKDDEEEEDEDEDEDEDGDEDKDGDEDEDEDEDSEDEEDEEEDEDSEDGEDEDENENGKQKSKSKSKARERTEKEGVRKFKEAWCMMNHYGKPFERLSTKEKARAARVMALVNKKLQ